MGGDGEAEEEEVHVEVEVGVMGSRGQGPGREGERGDASRKAISETLPMITTMNFVYEDFIVIMTVLR